jgi:hypothetical protein
MTPLTCFVGALLVYGTSIWLVWRQWNRTDRNISIAACGLPVGAIVYVDGSVGGDQDPIAGSRLEPVWAGQVVGVERQTDVGTGEPYFSIQPNAGGAPVPVPAHHIIRRS